MLFLILSLIFFFLAFHGATGLVKTGLLELVAAAPTVLTFVSTLRWELVNTFISFQLFLLDVAASYLLWQLIDMWSSKAIRDLRVTTSRPLLTYIETVNPENIETSDAADIMPGGYRNTDEDDNDLEASLAAFLTSWLGLSWSLLERILTRLLASFQWVLTTIAAVHTLWVYSAEQQVLMFLAYKILFSVPVRPTFSEPAPAYGTSNFTDPLGTENDEDDEADEDKDATPTTSLPLRIILAIEWINLAPDASVPEVPVNETDAPDEVKDENRARIILAIEWIDPAADTSVCEVAFNEPDARDEVKDENKAAISTEEPTPLIPPVILALGWTEPTADAPAAATVAFNPSPVDEEDNMLADTGDTTVPSLNSIIFDDVTLVDCDSLVEPALDPSTAPLPASPCTPCETKSLVNTVAQPDFSLSLDPTDKIAAATPATKSVLRASAIAFVPPPAPSVIPEYHCNAPTSAESSTLNIQPCAPPVTAEHTIHAPAPRYGRPPKTRPPFRRRTSPPAFWAPGGTTITISTPDGSAATLPRRPRPERPLFTRPAPEGWAPCPIVGSAAIRIVAPPSA
ncbi:hypothetical protein R3P38DRAFT_2825551 [Favolaschia claudopus]|uniref:Uncharacterized protein n=1 Tax=Favolaschia claudopus TaxID=2862362 RepID=A0AAW0EH72_9AGAR